ncbi:MAG: hypothetical protein A2845_02205 [Candidatus Lloydbacteria bacterium RIFCSPHIGHO2_01_FULL_49_22]|uniref:Uncharacterized protein n=1 Tax=Candidatus Lloydbacteria bacterium RIFCSPHIGHO2_01_FULL_49_22 TaxID=1798658 RepID=A0A1G2CUR8_9BACT|nr:MAG: hypothetical protein A2845_02205 [Candidatus Lloydbacteria bacterium RIFCSPHIGHO2_01_FULL_49_22]OGZ10265.1 MAG: hypothetical protein A3C14_01905 [Candidatus Lloydbacteria bacterium RIFCSPHIGHO2_02_FULL_50_18]
MTLENLAAFVPLLVIGLALVALRINPIRALKKAMSVVGSPKPDKICTACNSKTNYLTSGAICQDCADDNHSSDK